MADYRPYRQGRVTNPRLTRAKREIVLGYLVLTLALNWGTTQYVASRMGYARPLGHRLLGLYAPWDWTRWWARWHDAPALQPLWHLCMISTVFSIVFALIAVAAIHAARQSFADADAPDLYGTARFADERECREIGFLAPLRRAARYRGPAPLRDGIYLGLWKPQGKRRGHYLRDCGVGHVIVTGPTRSGKGINTIVPTLLTWRHSALVHDFKGELWHLTAGARRQAGQVVMKFDPTRPTESIRYNPLEEVRLGTIHEIADVQNIVQMLIDPEGRGFMDDHWKETAAPLFTGAILHILYAEPNKTLRGLIGLLSDPSVHIDDTIKRMLNAVHDPQNRHGWRTFRGAPTQTHPTVAESMREVMNKAEKERASIVSEVGKRLAIYRDPMVAQVTDASEFKISHLMNHERPVSLYLSIPWESRDRLKPVMRLVLNQIIHKLATDLEFQNGRPVSAHKRPMLLMLDEFPLLGRFEVFAEALAHMAGFGIRACIIAQDLTQIHSAYGRAESITSNCDTQMAFTPNKAETAQDLSRLIGETTVRASRKTYSTRLYANLSEPETRRSLMTPDEVLRLPVDEVLIFPRGQHAIRAKVLRYFDVPYFRQKAAIPPPSESDRIIDAPVVALSSSPPAVGVPVENWVQAHVAPDRPRAARLVAKPDAPQLDINFLRRARGRGNG